LYQALLTALDHLVDAQVIIDKLDRLPLALTQAGSYLRQTNMSVPSYIKHYDSTWKDLMEEQGRYLKREYGDRSSILTTWMISYKQVALESEEAANLLKLWGFLDREDLWYGLLASVRDFDEDSRVPEWLAVLAENEIKFHRAIVLLRRYSLVDIAVQQVGSHAIHVVLHAWCHHLSANEERRAMLLLAVRIVAQAVPAESNTTYWTLQRRLLPHGMHVYAKMSVLRRQHDWESYDEDDVPAWASHALGRLFAAQVKLAEAGQMYERALAGYEKVLGPEHTSALATVNNLANLYRGQGRLAEAEAMYERALAGKEKALGPEHKSTLGTVNNLGVLYRDQGRLAKAEAMYERALAGKEKALGPEHKSTLGTVNNLGFLYRTRHHLHISSIIKSRVRNSVFASKQDASSKFIVPVFRLWATWGMARTELVEHVGHMLLLEGSLQDAVVAFEQQISSSQEEILHSNVVCDGCETPIRLPSIRHVCASCNDVDLCPTCHQSYELEGRLDIELTTCQDHAFLAVPRDEWLTLPPGAVSTDGTTAVEWMNKLLVSLTESNVET
jgi:tetratricopeptide (TPR) repeat protein